MERVEFQPREGGKANCHMAFLDPTQDVLAAAMRGAWQRQTALTNNIANAETPGYEREDVNFQSALKNALANGESTAEMQFQVETQAQQPGPNGSSVDIGQESAKLAENGLDYQAMTQVLGAQDSMLSAAIGTV